MVRRWLLLVSISAVTATLGAGDRALSSQWSVTVNGQVRVTTSPDGLTTVVAVDRAVLDPDGLVDHAFRLHHREPVSIDFEGAAAIVFGSGRLTVAISNGQGWDFQVERALPALDEAGFTGEPRAVAGLSHHWGGKVRGSPAEVVARLLGEACSLLSGDPSCETCESGGGGATSCGVECEDGSGCSAQCGSGLFACCNCPDGCRCCPAQPGSGALKGWPAEAVPGRVQVHESHG